MRETNVENLKNTLPPPMRRIKFRAASDLLDMNHRTFRDWCLKHSVTIHPGIGGAFVLADDLEIGCKRQVEAEMKKKLGNDWENILSAHRTQPQELRGQVTHGLNVHKTNKITYSAAAEKFYEHVTRRSKQKA